MVKFLHGADFHLDSPFSALSPKEAGIRRGEQRQMVEDLVELSNGEQCDFVLLAGDLFDSDRVYADTLESLEKALSHCHAQVFIAPGNHDFYTLGSPYRAMNWPPNVHIFSANSIGSVYVPEFDAEIWGAAFTAQESPSLLEGFHVRDEGCLNLMVLHGDLGNSPYNPISPAQIAQSGLDYLALGHIHKASGLQQSGGTYYGWSGCPMGRGFDELGEKGVYIGTLDKGNCDLRFAPLSRRKYEILTVMVEGDSAQSIQDALPQNTQNDIYRIILEGQCDASNLRALYDQFAPQFFSLTFRDHTTAPVDLWKQRGNDTLKGLFLQELHEKMENSDQPHLYEMAAKMGLATMEGREVPEP